MQSRTCLLAQKTILRNAAKLFVGIQVFVHLSSEAQWSPVIDDL